MPLVSILLGVLWTALTFLLRSILIKFVVFFALYFVIIEILPVMFSMLPEGVSSLTSYAGLVPPTVWYFLDLFNIQLGLSVLVTAYFARFAIRRLPVIG